MRALIFSGHGGGALALSRRAQELAAIAAFIRERGGDVAERYLKHAPYERLRWAEEYNRSAAALGEAPFDPAELQQLRARCAELEREYGKHYQDLGPPGTLHM